MQRTAILNGSNINFDKDYSLTAVALMEPGVVEGLQVTENSVAPGKAFIQVERTSTTPSETFYIVYENTTAVTIDTSGTKKVFVRIPKVNINDPAYNSTSQNIAVIETGDEYPTEDYIALASITAGVITDAREEVKIKRTRKSMVPNSIFYVDNEGVEHNLELGVAGTLLGSNGETNAPTWQLVQSSIVGEVKIWSTASIPSGWLSCDGSAVDRTTYSALFAVIGTLYGAGNGSTTFNLPNLKGRVVAGLDTGQTEFNTIGKTGGAKTHTLTTAEMPAHSHTVNVYASGPQQYGSIPLGNTLSSTTHTTSSVGSGSAHNNLQPFISMSYIIKF